MVTRVQRVFLLYMWHTISTLTAMRHHAHTEYSARHDYDQNKAILFAEYARVAFCQKGAVESWNCGDMCEATPVTSGAVRFIGPGENYKVQGFVAAVPGVSERGQRCVVSYRGSVDLQNWMVDAMAWQKELINSKVENWMCVNCTVHHGFYVAYKELRNQTRGALQELQCADVSVTGHSLGGAVATMAALDIRAHIGLHVDPVFTFGSPRVGNSAFVKRFAELAAAQRVEPPQWRVVFHHDVVPRLGFREWGFYHIPREVYYTTRESDVYTVCDDAMDEDPQCSMATPVWKCLNKDHTSYFNRTFAVKQMPSACTGGPDVSKFEHASDEGGSSSLRFLFQWSRGFRRSSRRANSDVHHNMFGEESDSAPQKSSSNQSVESSNLGDVQAFRQA